MRRNIIKLTVIGLPLVVCMYVAFRSLTASLGEDRHSMKKRSQIDHILASYFRDELDNVPYEQEEWVREATSTSEPVPGSLVCNVRKVARGSEEESTDGVYPRKGNKDRFKDPAVPGNRVPSHPLIPPNRPIGCCPPGDPAGQPYKPGFSCCVNTVYNVSTQFCCIQKSRLLELNAEELDYCYPIDQIPFCRLKDLEATIKQPMTPRCRMSRKGTPQSCRLVCPDGTQSKDDIREVFCNKNGVWNTKPTCCEGCPKSFRLDLWLVIEIDQKIGTGGNRQLKRFLKSMLSYLPVSQQGVRVGITIFNSNVYHDVQVWDLLAHDSHKSINTAIDELNIEGSGSATGKALSYVANNAFTSLRGDRGDVPNQVLAILYGQPNDEYLEPATELKTIGQVTAISVGKRMSGDVLKAIGHDVHRVDDYTALYDLRRLLFKSLCDEACLSSYE